MIVLSCKDIHKAYGIDTVLEKITFNINEGEKVGLIGSNGAGKSTLFKILISSLEFDRGELFIDKSKQVGYLSQHLSLDNSNTIEEELLSVFSELRDIESRISELELKMREPYDEARKEYHDKIIKEYTTLSEVYINRGGFTYKGEINRVLTGLGFVIPDFNKVVNILSGGQKTRVALCKLLLTKPDILLLDEPTNHLDLDAVEWLEDYLKNYKGTIIIISHDRFFLDAITEKTLELISGRIDTYNGSYTSFIDLKKKNFEVQMKAFTLQKSEFKRQEEIIERYRSFNREKSVRAAESRQKALDKVERVLAPDKEQKSTKIKFETQIKSGSDVLHAENLSKSFGDKLLFKDLFIDMKREDKSALIGENGRGKTTLFRILMDNIDADLGFKTLGKNVVIGYYDQEQSNLNETNTIIDEVWDDFPEMSTTQVRNALAAFLFMGDDVFKVISNLSGGEKCRINLLKLMLSKANFLLLDEPTNHLDIMSREALEDSLLSYDGTILVISHDRYFLNKVINKIYELKIEGLKEYLGNYSYYVEKKKNPLRFQEEEENEGKSKTQIQLEKKKKREQEKLGKDEALKLKNIEKGISDLEIELSNCQKSLCLEEVYSSAEKSLEINKQISEAQSKLDSLYEEWEDMI